jgi:hypothetical protein
MDSTNQLQADGHTQYSAVSTNHFFEVDGHIQTTVCHLHSAGLQTLVPLLCNFLAWQEPTDAWIPSMSAYSTVPQCVL